MNLPYFASVFYLIFKYKFKFKTILNYSEEIWNKKWEESPMNEQYTSWSLRMKFD